MSGPDPAARLQAALRDLPAGPLGLAVSGGSDSLALMHLMAEWAADTGRALQVVTVDHGLRDAAAEEARFVASQAAARGLPHQTLHWRGWDGQGNLQDQARRARYGLMADWARQQGLAAVLLAHTQDDVAETLVMRLGRGAGVDGLSAMATETTIHGMSFLRPLLGCRRAELRAELQRRGLTWIDDPSNDDPKFDRVRVRQGLQDGALGFRVEALAQVATNLAQARQALDWAVAGFAAAHLSRQQGDLIIAAEPFCTLPQELARRLLGHALSWINGAGYPPRGAALEAMLQAAYQGEPATLQGVRMVHRKSGLHLFREFEAVKRLRATPDQPFDSRWILTGPDVEGLHVAPLGPEGLRACPNWRDSGRPAAAHHADPAIWRENELISAPLAGLLQGWQAKLAPDRLDFLKAPLSR